MTMQELLKDFLVSLQAECQKRREKSQDGVCASCPHHGFCDKWKYSPATWPPAWIDEMSISLLARYRPPTPPKKSPGQMVAEASALLKSAEARAAAKPRAALKDLRQKLGSLRLEADHYGPRRPISAVDRRHGVKPRKKVSAIGLTQRGPF